MKKVVKWLAELFKKSIPLDIEESEELVRRCKKKNIRQNGKIHKNTFYFGYNKISTDRSKYRTYKETFKYIPKKEDLDKWGLIKGIVQYIRKIDGVIEVKADPIKDNLAHALIICNPDKEKRNDIASSLSCVFKEIPDEEYRT